MVFLAGARRVGGAGGRAVKERQTDGILFECHADLTARFEGRLSGAFGLNRLADARFAKMQPLLTLMEGKIFDGCTQRLKN